MSDKVKRYGPSGYGRMLLRTDGDWVMYDYFENLEIENTHLMAKVFELNNTLYSKKQLLIAHVETINELRKRLGETA